MKKIVFIVLMVSSASVFANGYHHHHRRPVYNHGHNHSHGHNYGIAPLIVGGVIGYAIARSHGPQVTVQNPSYYVDQVQCSPWREITQSDGTVVRERICSR